MWDAGDYMSEVAPVETPHCTVHLQDAGLASHWPVFDSPLRLHEAVLVAQQPGYMWKDTVTRCQVPTTLLGSRKHEVVSKSSAGWKAELNKGRGYR
jgi:hypothetical protein